MTVGSAGSALAARPLTPEAFARYGEVLRLPDTIGTRTAFDTGLRTLRPEVPASLSLILAAPNPGRPIAISIIERHRWTSQSFLPLAPTRWLVVVAPDAAGGRPDLAAAEAFLPAPGQGVTLHPGAWHAPLTVLDAPAPFAILMWRCYEPDDEEVIEIAPFEVAV